MSINKKLKIILVLIITFILISIFLLVGLKSIKNEEDETINSEVINNTNSNNVIAQISNQNIIYEVTDSIGSDPNSERITGEKNKIQHVTGKTSYFTVKKLALNYINAIGNRDSHHLIEIISPEYILNNNITEDNIMKIFSNIPKIENNQIYNITIIDMLTTPINGSTEIYSINAKVKLLESDKTFGIKLIIGWNVEKNVYYVYPEQFLNSKGMNNLKVGDSINFDAREIENSENKFTYEIPIKELQVVTEYFDNYFDLLKYHKEESYNKLNLNYANKRFVSKEDFYKYLEENSRLINMAKLDEYRVISYKDYKDYICTDQYGNYYIFRQQNGVMNYSVFLDSYSVELESIKGMYNEANDNTKVSIQINKVKEMLNLKDYTSIYNKLNKTFRNNNFNNVSELEAYLKTRMYNINYIEINNITINDDYFVCECTLKNQENNSENKSMTIIIKLIDANNFEMSFSF